VAAANGGAQPNAGAVSGCLENSKATLAGDIAAERAQAAATRQEIARLQNEVALLSKIMLPGREAAERK
jgi:hypothetical protein